MRGLAEGVVDMLKANRGGCQEPIGRGLKAHRGRAPRANKGRGGKNLVRIISSLENCWRERHDQHSQDG